MILPDDVDKDKICAKVENGVLNIDLPKLSHEETHKVERTIEIGWLQPRRITEHDIS